MIITTKHLTFFVIFSWIVLLASLYLMFPRAITDNTRPETKESAIRLQSPSADAARVDTACPDGPKSNIYFLKTHKTGSSTVQNIFVRYAWDKNLLVGLPEWDIVFASYYNGTKFVRSQMQPLPPRRKPNMLLHHMVFDHKEVASTLPSDLVYLTILRDPATNFESLFKYMMAEVKSFERANASGGLKEFLAHPTKYFEGKRDSLFWWFAKNGLFFDFGYDNLMDTDEYIDKAIHEIDETFDLVLISEYFDMSLILLKDLLCWNMTDIVYLSVNARNPSTVEPLTDDLKKKIYEWNKADTALYRHFNETFWKRVENYGKERMERDLKELEEAKTERANFCVEDELSSNKDVKDLRLKMFSPEGMDMTQYILKKPAKYNETCRGLILPELQWWKKLSAHQNRLLFNPTT